MDPWSVLQNGVRCVRSCGVKDDRKCDGPNPSKHKKNSFSPRLKVATTRRNKELKIVH